MNSNKIKLGIAPIACTNDDMPDLGAENTFEQCISEMALAGYKGCEVGNKYPSDPIVLKEALDLRDMQICNRWFSSFILTKPFEEVEKDFRANCEFLKALGAKRIGASEQSYSIQGQMNTPVFEKKYVMNDEEMVYQSLAELQEMIMVLLLFTIIIWELLFKQQKKLTR